MLLQHVFPYLNLARSNVELLQDVDQEMLNFHPRVDAVGSVQHNNDVHVCLASCERKVERSGEDLGSCWKQSRAASIFYL